MKREINVENLWVGLEPLWLRSEDESMAAERLHLFDFKNLTNSAYMSAGQKLVIKTPDSPHGYVSALMLSDGNGRLRMVAGDYDTKPPELHDIAIDVTDQTTLDLMLLKMTRRTGIFYFLAESEGLPVIGGVPASRALAQRIRIDPDPKDPCRASLMSNMVEFVDAYMSRTYEFEEDYPEIRMDPGALAALDLCARELDYMRLDQ